MACPTHVPTLQPSTGVHGLASSQGAPSGSYWQVAPQQSPTARLPSSHCSPAVTTPLPQPVVVQLESHPSPSTRLWSSQVSGASITPLPHTVASSAPRSTRGPFTRVAPSRSVSPAPGTKAGSPALIAGDAPPRWKSPVPGAISNGSANGEWLS